MKEMTFLIVGPYHCGHLVNIAGFLTTSSQLMKNPAQACQAGNFGGYYL